MQKIKERQTHEVNTITNKFNDQLKTMIKFDGGIFGKLLNRYFGNI